jgi:hypothetical protein
MAKQRMMVSQKIGNPKLKTETLKTKFGIQPFAIERA